MNNYSLSPEQKQRLYRFTESIVNNRGDFYMVGSYGVDFTINYKGQPVEYKNRKFYQNGQELSAYQLNQLNMNYMKCCYYESTHGLLTIPVLFRQDLRCLQ